MSDRAESAPPTATEGTHVVIDGAARVIDSVVAGRDVYLGFDPTRRRDDVSPYPGLQPFDEARRQFFCGRDHEIEALEQRIRQRRFTAVVGPSGVGKSSLLRAGVLPRLRVSSDGQGREISTLVPTPYLAEAIASVEASERPMILCIDQAEAMLNDANRPADAATALVRLVTGPTDVHTILSLRSDFQSRFELYGDLMTLIDENIERVRPLDRTAWRAIIEIPARRAGLRLQEGLVEEIIQDVAPDPASLPLLAYALELTWERRFAGELTVEGYRGSGGVERAIQQQAEAAYFALGSGQARDFVAWAFRMRLTHQGVGPEPTRRTATMDELLTGPGGPDFAESFVLSFTEARLLNRLEPEGSATRIQVCHEALLRAWPRLTDWLQDDREMRVLASWLSTSTAEWVESGESNEALRPGPRADAARHAIEAGLLTPTGAESRFLDRSRSLQEQAKARERRFRRLKWFAVAAALLLIVVTAFAVTTMQSRNVERDLKQTAQVLRLAASARAEATSNRDRALLLAVNASRRQPTIDGQGALIDVLAAGGPRAFLRGRDGRRVAGARTWSGANPALVVVADGADTIRLVDQLDGQDVTEPIPTGLPISELVAIPRAGDLVVVASQAGQVSVVDLASRTHRLLPTGAAGRITSLAASDGIAVVAGVDGTVTGWDLSPPSARWVVRPFEGAAVSALAVGAASHRLLLGSDHGDLGWWDNSSRSWASQPVRISPNAVTGVSVRQIGGRDEALAVGTGALIRWVEPEPPAGIEVGPISAVDWLDDSTAAVGLADGSIIRVELRTGAQLGAPRLGHHNVVTTVQAAPDGGLLSLADDGVGLTWPPPTVSPVIEARAVDGPPLSSIAFGAQGVVTAQGGERVGASSAELFWLLGDGVHRGSEAAAPVVTLDPGDEATAFAVSRSGAVAVGLADGTTLVHRPNQPLLTLRQSGGAVSALALSPDGQFLAAGAQDRTRPGAPQPVMVWNLVDGGSYELAGHDLYVSALAYSPDGRTLASGSDDRTIRLWTTSGKPGAVLRGHTDMVISLEWADNDLLVSGQQQGVVRLWSTAEGRALGGPLVSGFAGDAVDLAIDPSGSELVVAQEAHLVSWPFGPDVWRRRACDTAARDLTSEEREVFLEGKTSTACE